MSNPDCAQVDSRPSTVPAGTVGLFEGARYYHCGAYRPEHACKMQALGLPFCRVCSKIIFDRISPLIPATEEPESFAAACRKNRLDIFVLGRDGAVYPRSWEGGGWRPTPLERECLGGFFSTTT